METRFIQTVLKFRRVILAAALVLTGAAGFYASKVGFDNSIEIWFLEGDYSLKAYKDFQERFGGDQTSIIALFSDDVFSKESLQYLEKITAEAEKLPFTHRVRSLTTLNVPRVIDGGLEISPLIPTVPTTPEALANLRSRILSNPTVVNNLVSADGKVTAILVELSEEGNDYPSKLKLNQALKDLREAHPAPGHRLVFSGGPVLDAEFFTYTTRDSAVLVPLCFLLIVLCIFGVFRRPTAVLMPVSVVLLALTWTFGLMGFLGIRIDVITVSLVPIVMAVGVADSVHVLSDFFMERKEGHTNEPAIVNAVSRLLVPCTITSLTTAVGMLALLISDLAPVRQFGWLSALGVTLAFLLSVTLGPILLLRVTGTPEEPHQDSETLTSRFLTLLAVRSRPYAKPIVAVAVVLFAWSCYSLSQLEVGANVMLYYKKDSPIRMATEEIDATLGGTTQLELIATTGEGGLKTPAVLQRLDKLNQWTKQQVGGTQTLSVLDGLREIDRALNPPPPSKIPGAVATGKLPDSSALIAQYYLLLEGEEDFDLSVQDNYSVARLTSRAKMSNAKEITEALPIIEEYLKTHFNDDELRVEATGYGKLLGDMSNYLLDSQVKSFLLAFIAVTLLLGCVLRSVKLALFSMIPNFLPVFFGLALMSALNIPLDPGTVMIGAIALGLVVDDTVHFLVRLRRHLLNKRPLEEAISLTTADVGRPILITSVILTVSFLVMIFASFTPNIHFGMVTAMVIILAFIADLVLLPAALRLFRPRL